MTHLVAAIQMTTSSDKAANLEKAEGLIRLAAARGARLVGLPEVFTLKLPATPTWNVAFGALVKLGAVGWLTVSVKLCIAFGLVPFEAVIVKL